jgi:hypothetical protein
MTHARYSRLLLAALVLPVAGCPSEPKTPVWDADCRTESERGTFELDMNCCKEHRNGWGCPGSQR